MNTKIQLSLGSDFPVCRSIDGLESAFPKIQLFSIMSLLSCSFLNAPYKDTFLASVLVQKPQKLYLTYN